MDNLFVQDRGRALFDCFRIPRNAQPLVAGGMFFAILLGFFAGGLNGGIIGLASAAWMVGIGLIDSLILHAK